MDYYQALIVDDEPAIREGLAVYIDWHANGFHIAGTAANGEEALVILQNIPVDLVITDVRMPKMDGICLCKTIRSLHLAVHVVILSGFRDFEYAQAALEFNVMRYILKPINEQQLLETLKSLKDELDADSKKKEILLESTKIIRDNFIRRLLNGDAPDEDELKDQGVMIKGHCYLCLGFNDKLFMETNPQIRQDKIVGQINNMLPYTCETYSYFEGKYYFLLISFSSRPDLSIIADNLKQLSMPGQEIIVSNIAEQLEHIPVIYQAVKRVMQNKPADKKQEGIYVITDTPYKSNILEPIIQYIEKNYQNKISLKQLADKYYLNPAYLGRLFKKYTNLSFNDFLENCRIEAATRLLQDPSRLISEIANDCGYNDYDYFGLTFKRKTGFTPSDYRSRYIRKTSHESSARSKTI
ncbi:MAG: response regulator [Clostridiaceae bacterium]|nr:response regulator [Clostridiaceae bacterium]